MRLYKLLRLFAQITLGIARTLISAGRFVLPRAAKE